MFQPSFTMVAVTHEVGFAREVAHRLVFMEHGAVVEEGPTKNLAVARWAIAEGVPMFAICRGLQVLNVASGGTPGHFPVRRLVPREDRSTPSQDHHKLFNGPSNFGSSHKLRRSVCK